ncbi:MAG TPA: 2-amino-4-hydroxy-6-hydroxymethyldihydropteridine diphosphokinase, partial [Thermoanaerobaculia bacterium]|nr:2-amino-4-hydroxy-6-hydroxymethyldihydropteridine diphosphokinase [Thermoanaerobaculia bacterium]
AAFDSRPGHCTMPYSVLIAMGANLGDRLLALRRAAEELRPFVSIVRASRIHETEPVGTPAGSPRFLNMVVAGYTRLPPEELLERLLEVERRLGRRRGVRNAPRVIDIDLILHSAHLLRTRRLELPHARYLEREFVRAPLRELQLRWRDPRTGVPLW